MGRTVLLAGLALLALACDPQAGRAPGDPTHPDLACAACHDGGLSDREIPAATDASCTAGGCHTDGGPGTIVVAGASISHRNHGDTAIATPSCAGCHSHPGAGASMSASTDACFLCHSDRLNGEMAQDCRFCHEQPQNVAFASQGTPLPHSGLPWLEATCIRCHFDVARTTTHVDLASCTDCHQDTQRAARLGAGTDLHPQHGGLNCTQCHEAGQHQIRAMSSAVFLDCSDCHSVDHGVPVEEAWSGPDGCASCHSDSHQAQQALFLGHVPGRASSQPSFKFLEGMTCKSCHARVGGQTEVAAAAPEDHEPASLGTPSSCGACHRPEYGQIPGWWAQGGQERIQAVSAYLERAESTLGASSPDTVLILLGRARSAVDLVETAGIQHNLELGDRVLRESLDHIGLAYRLSAQFPPAAPDLGTPARRWFCSSCHYPIGQPSVTGTMPAEPHADLRRKLEREWVDPTTEPGDLPPV